MRNTYCLLPGAEGIVKTFVITVGRYGNCETSYVVIVGRKGNYVKSPMISIGWYVFLRIPW